MELQRRTMHAIAFDTLKLARKLESAGFPAKQAQDASAALAETFAEWQSSINLATRDDIQKLDQDIQKLDTSLRAEISKLAAQTEQRIADKAAETIKWLIGMSVAQAGLIIGILKLHV
jgi:hypothetical protein